MPHFLLYTYFLITQELRYLNCKIFQSPTFWYPLHAPLLALLKPVADFCIYGTRQNKYSRHNALTSVSV
jgi:hypothetical protein